MNGTGAALDERRSRIDRKIEKLSRSVVEPRGLAVGRNYTQYSNSYIQKGSRVV